MAQTPVTSSAEGTAALTEKKPYAPMGEPQLDTNTDITHLYLTFHTDLPRYATPQQITSPEGQNLPEQPDLDQYMSPFEWSPARKSVILVLSCIATFLTAYTSGAYSPPTTVIAHEFGVQRVIIVVGITTFCIGFGFAPMALAPLSEVWGRYPIFICAGFVFVVFQALSSVMPDAGGLLVVRFFCGAGASVFSAVVGGVIADLWNKEDRNTPMALFSGAVLGGTGAGPLVSAAIMTRVKDDTLAWKWTFWHQVIADAIVVLSICLFFSESRGSVLLTQKARKINKWYDEMEKAGAFGVWVRSAELEASVRTPNSPSQRSIDNSDTSRDENNHLLRRRIRWVVKEDEMRPSLGTLVAISVKRPFHMLFTEPVVFCFSLWAAFSWGILYLSFTVVPFLYGSNLDISSRVYIAMMAGAVVATVAGISMERLMKHPQWKPEGPYDDSKFWEFMRRRFPADSPEARLYFPCITAMLLPAGLFVAFMVPQKWQEYAQAVGIGFAFWGIYSVYLATFNYLADTYTIYASSALAAQSLCRNLLGGIFPVIATPLFQNVGIKGAGGILGGVATALTAIPWVLMFFGPRIRANSKFAIVSQHHGTAIITTTNVFQGITKTSGLKFLLAYRMIDDDCFFFV